MTQGPLTTKICTTTEALDFTMTLSEYQCGGAYVLNRQTGSDQYVKSKIDDLKKERGVQCISTH